MILTWSKFYISPKTERRHSLSRRCKTCAASAWLNQFQLTWYVKEKSIVTRTWVRFSNISRLVCVSFFFLTTSAPHQIQNWIFNAKCNFNFAAVLCCAAVAFMLFLHWPWFIVGYFRFFVAFGFFALDFINDSCCIIYLIFWRARFCFKRKIIKCDFCLRWKSIFY